MKNIFTQHPHSQGMNYWSHLWRAFSYSFRMLGAACLGIIHGIFPFMCKTCLSDAAIKMAKEFNEFNENDRKP
ncbi:MAG: hypothetical protein KIT27_02535 [Legionellales bacterium]|nr:hypothetical protein [Legionellales bacterium]